MPATQQGRRLLQQLAFISQIRSALGSRGCHVCHTGLGPSTSGSTQLITALGRGLATSRQRSPYKQLKALFYDYKKLAKFRLSALVALTASAGFVAGSEDSIDYAKLAWTSLGTFGAAACANTFNQLYEIVNDSRMARTCNRPLPAGRVGSKHALAFALLSGAAGLWMLHEKTNPLTTTLGAANILLYAGIYTPLKQVTILNTWVGAVVGAIPPLMGWAAAAGQLEPGAWVLAAALFSWQMPHFLALAWMCQDDYTRGGFKMLPSVDPTGRRTAAVALRHCAFLLPLGAIAVALQIASPWFAGEAAVLAAAMGADALSFRAQPTAAGARKLFRGSLLYLPLLLAGLALHRQPNTHSLSWQDLQGSLQDSISEVPGNLGVDVRLPEQLQPGKVWRQLQELQGQLHWPKLRPIEERYGYVLEMQRQIQGMKCPSRAYGDSIEAKSSSSSSEQEPVAADDADDADDAAAEQQGGS